VAREEDFAYWAARFGVTVPAGESARNVLASGSLQPELAEIVDGFRRRR
jgi:hypothetical protein